MHSVVVGSDLYHTKCQDDPVLMQVLSQMCGVGFICVERCTGRVIITLLETRVVGWKRRVKKLIRRDTVPVSF